MELANHPELAGKIELARRYLDHAEEAVDAGKAEAQAALTDLTLTSASSDQLRARAVYDDSALHELGRRGELAHAA